MKTICSRLSIGAASMALVFAVGQSAHASSHMDAPLITLDPPANTTDVYAFRSTENGENYLTTALAVYPFEAPGIGPNNYRFDDNVLYEIHVALGDDVDDGRKTLSYQFQFETRYKDEGTILQSFLGILDGTLDESGFDVNQNLRQTYTVTKVDHRTGTTTLLGDGQTTPNNQGLVTPLYNRNDDGEMTAKPGVDEHIDLDPYTQQAIFELDNDYRAFAGQRDDGFYADIQSIFDLDFGFGGPNKPFDSQGGFNVHTIVLDIPIEELTGGDGVVGVYATTSRQRVTVLKTKKTPKTAGKWVQVGRQGNPLFNEALVFITDKDLYNRTSPRKDKQLFETYALNPLLATVLGLNDTDRADIAGIFIPDMIRVDVTTGPARLAGQTDDTGFSRLSVFGGDTLLNGDGITVAGGFPNGRRFGDDVVDITLLALGVELNGDFVGDRVDANDISFNKVFPYAATPLNGRNHGHH